MPNDDDESYSPSGEGVVTWAHVLLTAGLIGATLLFVWWLHNA